MTACTEDHKARISTDILLRDIEKAFLHVGINQENRHVFCFLFKVNGQKQHFRFTQVPFGAGASSFILRATLQYHYDQQPEKVGEMIPQVKSFCKSAFLQLHNIYFVRKFLVSSKLDQAILFCIKSQSMSSESFNLYRILLFN